jgi:hypothetical protein
MSAVLQRSQKSATRLTLTSNHPVGFQAAIDSRALRRSTSQSRGVGRLLRVFGIVLVLGGLGHSIGVIHLYLPHGVPDANRVLLDTWVAEAQIIGGSVYAVAFRAIVRAPLLGVVSLAIEQLVTNCTGDDATCVQHTEDDSWEIWRVS